jgi:hypothetical protein
MSVWGFDSNKSKILDNLGYLIPEEEFKSDSKTTKEATSSDTSTDNIFADRNQMAAYLVNKTLDGDSNIIKATNDVYARGKAKALLMKINKGTAERPAMPEAGEAIEKESSHSYEQIEKDDGSDNTQDDLFIKLVEEGVKGNMDEINGLEDKVLRGKIKAAIVKAKRSS